MYFASSATNGTPGFGASSSARCGTQNGVNELEPAMKRQKTVAELDIVQGKLLIVTKQKAEMASKLEVVLKDMEQLKQQVVKAEKDKEVQVAQERSRKESEVSFLNLQLQKMTTQYQNAVGRSFPVLTLDTAPMPSCESDNKDGDAGYIEGSNEPEEPVVVYPHDVEMDIPASGESFTTLLKKLASEIDALKMRPTCKVKCGTSPNTPLQRTVLKIVSMVSNSEEILRVDEFDEECSEQLTAFCHSLLNFLTRAIRLDNNTLTIPEGTSELLIKESASVFMDAGFADPNTLNYMVNGMEGEKRGTVIKRLKSFIGFAHRIQPNAVVINKMAIAIQKLTKTNELKPVIVID